MSQLLSSLGNLEYFKSVYRLKSYALAARAIPMSYQGLRKAIGKIENEIGHPLFESNADGSVVSTRQGDLLYEFVTRLDEETRELKAVLDGESAETRLTIRIAASIGAMWYFDFFFFEGLEKTSSLRLEVDEYSDTVVDLALKGGEYNLALTVAPFDDELQTLCLGKTMPYAWVRSDDPLAANESISAADLQGRDLFMLRNSKLAGSISEALASRRIKPGTIRQLNEMVGVFASAMGKGGVGITVAPLGRLLEGMSDAVCVPLSNDFPAWEYGLSCRRDYAMSQAESEAADFIVESARLFQERDDLRIFS